MAWNLADYEDVATLNRWFQDNYPAGRINLVVEHLDTANQEIFIRCDLYRDSNDSNPAVTNYARGKSSDYPKQMQRWWVEDTSTSAIGRAILLIKAAEKTATRDSMVQVARSDAGHKVEHPWKPAEAVKEVPNEPETVVWDDLETKAVDDQETFIQDLQQALGAEVVGFKCKHGDMLKKEGVSPKTSKPYFGYVCGAKTKAEQCDAKWGKIVGGKWVFEGRASD
jgi:hypothetical protein